MKRVTVNTKPVTFNGKPDTKFQCPECGKWAYGDGHTVDADGNINPSLICGSCGWHGWGKVVAETAGAE